MGQRSQSTQSDWDEALYRFNARYCTHPVQGFCALESAWSDGWDDAGEGNQDRRPKKISSSN